MQICLYIGGDFQFCLRKCICRVLFSIHFWGIFFNRYLYENGVSKGHERSEWPFPRAIGPSREIILEYLQKNPRSAAIGFLFPRPVGRAVLCFVSIDPLTSARRARVARRMVYLC